MLRTKVLRFKVTNPSLQHNYNKFEYGSSKRYFFNSSMNSQRISTKINSSIFCKKDCDCDRCRLNSTVSSTIHSSRGNSIDKFKRSITLDKSSKNNKDYDCRPDDIDGSGIKSYCSEVYTNVAKFLGVTTVSGAVGYGLVNSLVPHLESTGLTILVGSWLFCFGGSFYQVYQLTKDDKTEEDRLSHAYKMHMFMGLVITPSLLMFHEFIPHALVGTAALTAGPIMMALKTPSKTLLPYGSALYTCLGGLVGVGLTSVIAPLLGFTSLGMFAHNIDLYGGVLLFTLYNAFDTHKMLDDYEKGNRDVLCHATNYSLSAINIFIRLLEIMSKLQKK
jgi:FtsH-binding integral membrane protein